MNKYFVTFHLREFDEYFWQLIPEHRELINDLLIREVIEIYGVNLDRNKGWLAINAKDEDEVADIIETFPIRDYFSYDIEQLFIFDNALGLMPKMVLN
jgi:hypothetical protein